MSVRPGGGSARGRVGLAQHVRGCDRIVGPEGHETRHRVGLVQIAHGCGMSIRPESGLRDHMGADAEEGTA
ncbi:hypothetical protein ACRS5S_12965 [Nocardia asiatica]|uniref:hypothetical protein n=1 Tax=Nocardia asiatica TaxID=209252 RepID=UPI0005B97EAE|nr:hypothetical protein [Nocardia asiatica]